MLTVQPLYWDSFFFNLRIGKVVIESPSDLATLIVQTKYLRSIYDLIYIFSTEKISPIDELEKALILVDEKTIYEMDVISSETYENVHLYTAPEPNKELYKLALISGVHSRFKLDKNFPENSYERLYIKWIEESVNGNIANAVFVHTTNDKIDGMITVKWDDECADIGLVAVDSDVQSHGIGSMLIRHLNSYLKHNTYVKILSVATQWGNTNARKWYEKNGFRVKSITNIYHWWL